jgi:hypothetical protein
MVVMPTSLSPPAEGERPLEPLLGVLDPAGRRGQHPEQPISRTLAGVGPPEDQQLAFSEPQFVEEPVGPGSVSDSCRHLGQEGQALLSGAVAGKGGEAVGGQPLQLGAGVVEHPEVGVEGGEPGPPQGSFRGEFHDAPEDGSEAGQPPLLATEEEGRHPDHALPVDASGRLHLLQAAEPLLGVAEIGGQQRPEGTNDEELPLPERLPRPSAAL